MRCILASILVLAFSLTATCQADNPEYDKALADSLGGDDYGMKAYGWSIQRSKWMEKKWIIEMC